MFRSFLFVLVISLALALPALAQFESGSVVGTVRDTTGGVVADATVTLVSPETGVDVKRPSGADGTFEFVTVKPGIYVVSTEKDGLAVALVDNVQVQVGSRTRVDLTMSVSGLTERVEVTASAPLLETDRSERSQVITAAQIRELPLNGREYSALALLTTGVRQSALNKSTNGTPREGAFNVNGLRSVFNNFLIDGVDNNAYGTSNQGFSNQVMQPPPDAVAEFKVVTNNQSAEYGRAAGATVNVAYRSGTNQVHGAGWEFFRDTALNASNYFKPVTGEKPPLRRNQFGGVLGGPILKNRAFFFADYEGFRQNRKQTTFVTIPTTAQRQGVLAVDIRDPRTGAVYAAGTPIPMTAFAQNVLSGLPDPNLGTAANNYSVLQQFTNDSDKGGGKIDVRLSPSAGVFGRYGHRKLSTFDQPPLPMPSGGSGNGTIYARNKQLALGATYTGSARSLSEVRFGWSSTQGGKNPPALGSPSALDAFGISGLPSDTRIAGGLPTQLITGYADLGRQATNPQWQYPTVWNPKINETWLFSRHSVKTGYEFQHINVEVQDVNPLYGRDTYGSQLTKPNTALPANNVYNLADFMLGLRSQYALSNPLVANIRRNMHFLYVQDDFRANDKLTINLGVRYEYATPLWEADNVLSNFDPTARQMVLAKDGSIEDRALVKPDRNNLGPRLGLAYSLTPKTVVRAGWGVSYVHNQRTGAADLLPINGPQVVNAVVNQTNPADPSFRTTEQGYPAGFTDPARFNPLASNITYIPDDYRSGRVQSWFASFQRELVKNMLLDLAYVGNRADDLVMIANYNQAVPNDAAGSLSIQARRPIPEFADITYVFNEGKSRYNAFQTKLEWRLRDVTLLSSLTLSKAKDNGAQSLENQNGNFPGPQDFNNLAAEYGTGAYDQPYNSTTSFVWSLPFGRGHRWGGNAGPAMDALVGGWQVSGINSVASGEPVTFVYAPTGAFQVSGIQQDFRGANNYRPNVTCDAYAASPSITGWFNRDCVVNPTDPSQPFGNAARNTVRGPNFWSFDFAAVKRVALAGSSAVEVRVEAFNLFNRTNFAAPNGNRSAAGFGTITAAYDPRQVQLGVKLLW